MNDIANRCYRQWSRSMGTSSPITPIIHVPLTIDKGAIEQDLGVSVELGAYQQRQAEGSVSRSTCTSRAEAVIYAVSCTLVYILCCQLSPVTSENATSSLSSSSEHERPQRKQNTQSHTGRRVVRILHRRSLHCHCLIVGDTDTDKYAQDDHHEDPTHPNNPRDGRG
jgi:hypothetical protein